MGNAVLREARLCLQTEESVARIDGGKSGVNYFVKNRI